MIGRLKVMLVKAIHANTKQGGRKTLDWGANRETHTMTTQTQLSYLFRRPVFNNTEAREISRKNNKKRVYTHCYTARNCFTAEFKDA